MSQTQKIKYGLSHVYYAVVTETTQSGVTTSSYGTLKPWQGAVSLSMTPQASKSVFRADDSDYYVSYGDGTIEGDLECALVPEDLKKDLGWVKTDNNGILVESADEYKETKFVALEFQINGDVKAVRHCLYKCSLSRPSLGSKTTGENGQVEPVTETVTVTATPRADEDRYLHAYTTENTATATYAGWFSTVPVPTFS